MGAQYKVRGTVYDSSRTYPLEAVSVYTTSGRGTVTDINGFYQLDVSLTDSIQFSYLGKPTMKFPVKAIPNLQQFDLSLRVAVTTLREVKVQPRNYRLDSIQNRKDYEKVFNFRRPNIETLTTTGGPAGAGLSVTELIRAFQFRRNRSMERFQQRLITEEQEKYVTYRFNKALVRRLTGLSEEELPVFMQAYRPTYEFIIQSSDYQFQKYIKDAAADFKGRKAF